MRTNSAPTIRLKNYTPPIYTISTVDLKVELAPSATRIRSILNCVRSKNTPIDAPMILDGDELQLIQITVDGKKLSDEEYSTTAQTLKIIHPPKNKKFTLEIITLVSPIENKKLMGLYQSQGIYCTQCEAEGFRRITYFLDRPDVLAVYTVRLEAKLKDCPILLSNGNLIKQGKLSNNRHFAIWHDPHPKPSYLFALVGGKLDVLSDNFKTASGQTKALNIYVEKGKAKMATYAMGALKRSMVWDEKTYGCEYDLDVFNIVAVSDFNMGAMENKGLNIFNDKYILAKPDLATDTDYMQIEAIIGHEYFHNWTGNRITCRDWFQLCLKEGLTVYRDQEFSADLRSPVVQRIQQVRGLKAAQFPEDAGPLAHSVRPESYQEINNFYTATVYQKGAELVRMLSTLVGPKAYRKSTDLYLKRHDGQAAVVEDWLNSFEDVAKIDLSQFSRWYSQAGTPSVEVQQMYDEKSGTYVLKLEQSIPPTPGQRKKKVVPIPIRFGLMDAMGNELPIVTKNKEVVGDVIVFDKKKLTLTFEGLKKRPIPSLLRSLSAPVNLIMKESDKARVVRAQHDSDLYNRWDALNNFAMSVLLKGLKKGLCGDKGQSINLFINTLIENIFNDQLDPEFRAQIATLPSEKDIAREKGKNIDPDAVNNSLKKLRLAIGNALGVAGMKFIQQQIILEESASDVDAAGYRALRNAVLPYLAEAKIKGSINLVEKQFKNSTNMTDRMGALNVLLQNQQDNKIANRALKRLFIQYQDHPLVIDKWFFIQALLPGKSGLKRVKEMTKHPLYSLENPNRARSLLAPFANNNLTAFHRADGSGYKFYIDQILAIDKLNPQLAARLLTLMNNWKMFEKTRATHAKHHLKRLAATKGLSRDVQEIVDRSLD